MITAIGTLDDRLKQVTALYPDPAQPVQARHLLILLQDVELVLLNLAVLEKRLEQATSSSVLGG